jgi:predicted GH43/DUF377 family glycosyl hydrolase
VQLVRRTGVHLCPDASRLLPRLFVAGQDNFGTQQTRGSLVLDRVMQLSEEQVEIALGEVVGRYGGRHENLFFLFDAHAQRFARPILRGNGISESRWKLIGAMFTHEYSIEGASLSNPSIVPHPDQSGCADGDLRFVMTVRCIGEGHRSSIGFRTGTITGDGTVAVDTPGRNLDAGAHGEAPISKSSFTHLLEDLHTHGENARFVLGNLGDTFTFSELEVQSGRLLHNRDSYRNVDETIRNLHDVAGCTYSVRFGPTSRISERVLWPFADKEIQGMEDARCVRFVDDSGQPTWFASYTAFDGRSIAQQLLSTTDFENFESRPLTGRAATGKGLAIFPRTVGGQYVALSRADHESNAITTSDHIEHWDEMHTVQVPTRPWELIQMGNSGSPIETEAGWLALTHAVGPMRTYCLSAMLLDLNDPTRVLGSLDRPLMSPEPDESYGYVPNVVYSCGSLLHHRTLVIPYGIADHSIGVATVSVDDLLEVLTT